MTANHGGERTGEQAGALASVRGPGGDATASTPPVLEVFDGDETVLAVEAGVVHAVVGSRSATRRFVEALSGAAVGRRRRRAAEVVRIEGKVVTLASRAASSAAGIAVVTGGQAISWTQDVGDNVLLGNEHGSSVDGFGAAVRAALRFVRPGVDARGTDRERVVRAIATVGLTTEPTTAVAELTTLERRLVELARAVAAGAAVVIVDESGAGLSTPEREHWQAALRAVAAAPRPTGTAPVVLLVTGTVTGLAAVASAVTLLGTGSGAGGPRTLPVSDAADERRVLDALAAGLGNAAALRGVDRTSDSGRSCPDRDARPTERAGGLVVERWHASHPADSTRTVVDGLSFTCAPGEVLGLFGPLDSGAGEVLLSLFGRSYGATVRGTVAIDGETVDLSTMDRARAAGLLYTTEHPIRYDLAFLGGVPSSVSPTSLTRMVSTGLADGRRAYPATTAASGLAPALPGAHRGPTAEQFTASLRSLLDTPARVVLLAEPFGDRRDAGAAERVDLIRAIADSGRAVVVAGDDPSALVEVSDRVIAVRNGRVGSPPPPDEPAPPDEGVQPVNTEHTAASPSASGAQSQTDPDETYTIGVDFGTLSGRAVVVRVSDGAELGSAVLDYPHAVMDRELASTGATLPPDWALQVPADYVAVIKSAVPRAVEAAGIDPAAVIGIGTDFTACTMVPVIADGTPLNELPEYADRPHAYVKLWKHHSAQPQADRINELAAERGESWLPRYGGLISSEWEFAKGLQLLEEDPELYERMDHWVEAADWIIWQLTGRYVRNACTAGYKGIYQDGAYPSHEFLAALNPAFERFADDKVEHEIGELGAAAGTLSAEAAAWTGLREGIAVAVGNVDAHVAAPAAQAVSPGQMVAIMGTSTCHVMNGDVLREVPGMCGVVDGGIIAGLYGYEAGQSGVGDIFAWYVENQVPARYTEEAAARGVSIHEYLTSLIQDQPVGAHGLVALDWHSGNRSVLVDHELSGTVLGLTLSTRTEEVYRALFEATAFGTRKIVETFNASGVPVTEFIVAGGLQRNPFLMQTYSDILRLPISITASAQGPALGSAIHAAVAAGAYPDVPAASAAMGKVDRAVYTPNEAAADAYDLLYAEYATLHDYFGRGANDVMKRLKRLRRAALGGGSDSLPSDTETTALEGATS